jgi:hypothetical protein
MTEYQQCIKCEAIFDYVDSDIGGFCLKRRNKKGEIYEFTSRCPLCHDWLIAVVPRAEIEYQKRRKAEFDCLISNAETTGKSVVGVMDHAQGEFVTLTERYKAVYKTA